MRNIVVSMWTTVDGYVAGLDDEMDWLAPDGHMMEYETSLVDEADGLLLGRETHRDFASAWPQIAADESVDAGQRAYAQRVDQMQKYVASRSGDVADWDNTSRIESLDSRVVTKLRSGGDRDLVIYGSLGLIGALQDLNEIDRYDLLVHPIAIGEGKALFTTGKRIALTPTSVDQFPSGVALMRYQPIPSPTSSPRGVTHANA